MSTADALPDLTDDDINVLDKICKHAEAASFHGPIKALTQSQDALFGTRARGSRHYGVLMRWIIRVGEAVTVVRRSGGDTSLTHELRQLLEEHGITVIDDDDDVLAEEPHLLQTTENHGQPVQSQRRVSFDDARYEETWLSTHLQSLDIAAENSDRLESPVIESDNERHHRRAHSTDKPWFNARHAGSTPYKVSASTLPRQGQVHHQRSQAEEDHIVTAFEETRLAKTYRFCFHQLCDAFLHLESQQNWLKASQHDHRMLARQSLSQWNENAHAIQLVREDKRKEAECLEILAHFWLDLRYRVFNQWRSLTQIRQRVAEDTRQALLESRYFNRWRQTTEDNLVRRQDAVRTFYFRTWLQQTQNAKSESQQANSQHELSIKKKYFRTWLLQTQAQKYERKRLLTQNLKCWMHKSTKHAKAVSQAVEHEVHRLLDKTTLCMRKYLVSLSNSSVLAQAVYTRSQQSMLVTISRKYAELKPREDAVTDLSNHDVKHKILSSWRTAAEYQQIACLINERHINKRVLGQWRLGAQIRKLRRQAAERTAFRAITTLASESRVKMHRRLESERGLRSTLQLLKSNMEQRNQLLREKEQEFQVVSWRITVSSCVQRLHRDLGIVEDMDRSAIELDNLRILPKSLQQWISSAKHIQEMRKWSEDAAFYIAAKRSLKAWQAKTIHVQQERRRKAYDQVRTRIKERMVRSMLRSWHTQTLQISRLHSLAAQHQFTHDQNQAFKTIDVWRIRRQEFAAREQFSQEQDQYKLVSNAIEAMQTAQERMSSLYSYAEAFELETMQSRAVPFLRKLRLTTFSSLRLEETADLLLSRLRDRHNLLMIRQWAAVTAEKRAKTTQIQEPDSPSLRPASRAASRISNVEYISPAKFGQSVSATPAYLRTPSHSRKRFRALPAIAPYTPFAPTFATATPAQPQLTNDVLMESTTPKVTPFRRKLRAGGIQAESKQDMDASNSVFGRSIGLIPPTTGKSVRFTSAGRRTIR